MKKMVNASIRLGILCLLVMGTAACHTSKQARQSSMGKPAQQNISEDNLRKQREAEQLKLCQEQLGALRDINNKQYQQYKQAFDRLMSGASQYAGLRKQVNDNTQETVDALYRYKVSYLCAGVNQSVLTGLAERGERIK